MSISKEALNEFLNNKEDLKEEEEEPEQPPQEEKKGHNNNESNQLRKDFLKLYDKESDPLNKLIYLGMGLIVIKGGEIPEIPEYQREILKFYCKYHTQYNLNIQACVGHAKTTLITDIIQVHEYIQSRNHTILYLSESDKVAQTRLNQIVSMLEKYKSITGENIKFTQNNTSDFKLLGNEQRDPSGQAKGILSKFTGAHVEQIILDDIETLDTVSVMNDIINALDTKVNERLSPTGKQLAINTPYMENGAVSILERRNGWLTLKISFSESLVDPHLLESTIKIIELAEDIPEATKDKVIGFLYEKLIFNSITVLEISCIGQDELIKKYSSMIRACIDFSYKMKIIERGIIIEEKSLPEWGYFVKTQGQKVLNSYIDTPKSYMQTYALTAEFFNEGGFFTNHSKAMRKAEETKQLELNIYHKVFSYDMSLQGRKGTVITEALFTEKEIIVKRKVSSFNSINEFIAYTNTYPDSIHVPENTGGQKVVLELAMANEIPEEIHKNIYFHTTPSNPNTILRSKMEMNHAFSTGEMVIEEEGEGIDELKKSLHKYAGIKKGKDQFDDIDSLWFLFYNREGIRELIANRLNTTSTKKSYKKNRKIRGL